MKETQTIEFKRQFVSDLNKEIIAFANTNGGEILIGIDNNGLVAGLPISKQLNFNASIIFQIQLNLIFLCL